VVESRKCERGKKKPEVQQKGLGMEVGAIQQMLSRLGKLQEDYQRQVNSVTVEASAGGGMVAVKMNGQKQVVDVKIEPEVFAGKDQEMLQDLVRAAMNEASRRVDEELANQIKNLAGGIPGMAGLDTKFLTRLWRRVFWRKRDAAPLFSC
jgi:DNA-binding YbaB/EbfC family protein